MNTMINNKIKYLSTFGILLLTYNSGISIAMDSELYKNEINLNFEKKMNTNCCINNDVGRKENIMNKYCEVQEQLKMLCNTITTFEHTIYNNCGNINIVSTIQNIYDKLISIIDAKNDNDLELGMIIETNSLLTSQDISDIKHFIKELKEKLSVINFLQEDTDNYYDKINEENRKKIATIHSKHANVMSEFMRMCYHCENNNESNNTNYGKILFVDMEFKLNTGEVKSNDIDIENNLNIGKINNTPTIEEQYSKKYQERLNYGRIRLNQLLKSEYGYLQGDTISNRLVLKYLLELSQLHDSQTYFAALQSTLGIQEQNELLDAKKTFNEKRITNLIDQLNEKTVQELINKLTSRLSDTFGNKHIKDNTYKKILNNASNIKDSYKLILETGHNLIDEVNTLQEELETLFDILSNKSSMKHENTDVLQKESDALSSKSLGESEENNLIENEEVLQEESEDLFDTYDRSQSANENNLMNELNLYYK